MEKKKRMKNVRKHQLIYSYCIISHSAAERLEVYVCLSDHDSHLAYSVLFFLYSLKTNM